MKHRSLALLFGIIASILFSNPLKVHAQPQKLNLTPEQKTQWEEIRAQTKAQIKNILTPEQQQQFQTLTEQGKRPRQAFKELNTSEDQKNQMREISKSAREQMINILTPEQQEQFRQQRQMK